MKKKLLALGLVTVLGFSSLAACADPDTNPGTPGGPGAEEQADPAADPGINPGGDSGVNPGGEPGVDPGQNAPGFIP